MARRNGIYYEGRTVNRPGKKDGKPSMLLSKSKQNNFVLDLVIAEQFRGKNSNVDEQFKDPTKAADDYVNTYTAWHRLRIFADADNADFIKLVTDPKFNHGAIVEVDAQYEEVKPWTDNGGKEHAGRQELIYWAKGSKEDPYDAGFISIKVLPDGRVLGARDEHEKPLYDGNFDSLPALGGSGGGGPAAPEYKEDEGF